MPFSGLLPDLTSLGVLFRDQLGRFVTSGELLYNVQFCGSCSFVNRSSIGNISRLSIYLDLESHSSLMMLKKLDTVVGCCRAAAVQGATWCICKDGVGDAMLQKTLDYACGAGADCNPIHSNGPCFNPNTVRAHCNYAVNSYFQRKGQAVGSCDFAGTAIVSPSDPSFAGCAFPSSVSAAGTTTNTTPSTMIPGTTTPTSTTTPYGSTTPVGVLGGAGTGLGPSGIGINTDYSDGGLRLHGFISFATLLLPSLIITFCG
ncbi:PLASMODESMATA CALLOSE-BINDING PROTEIN 3 [Hibiscus syriacus]|uniref:PLASMODESMATA CALLOSE-BINDING PROTEIN 3 n=1 Tax=Hibiscus syriacus TaxID=106335 RepID=A0A6A2YKC8_HIBSY|nr:PLASMODESMATA CALLOSE-BINDING PROTEIN 3 [Hibiscus syriacus]